MKVAIFAFNGEAMCFSHALMNVWDLFQKGQDVKLIIEGSATRQIKELADPSKPFSKLYQKIRDHGLIDCVCNACAGVTKALESAKEQELPICSEMGGHPSVSSYLEAGYEIIVF